MNKADWRDSLKSLIPNDYVPDPEPLQEAEESQSQRPCLSVVVEKRKGGKVATIVTGFDIDDSRAAEVAAVLKRRLATGGSARGGEILIQGDRRIQVKDILKQEGYKVK